MQVLFVKFVVALILVVTIDGKSSFALESISRLLKSLSRGSPHDMKGFTEKKTQNALSMVMSSQAALKTLDGVTHQLRNAVKDNTSLKSRFNKFMKSKSKGKKEAAKIYEYTNTVEKGLQASEILQCVSISSASERKQQLLNCGLLELKRYSLEHSGLNCTLSVLCNASDSALSNLTSTAIESNPLTISPDELIIAVSDSVDVTGSSKREQFKGIQQLFMILNKDDPLTVDVTGTGVTDDEISVQPTLLTLSRYALTNVSEFILADIDLTPTASYRGKPKLALQTNEKKDMVFVGKRSVNKGMKVDGKLKPKRRLPHRLRFIGYSTGGAVASYMAMTLDGTMNVTKRQVRNKKELKGASSGSSSSDVTALAPFVGRYHGRVRCMTLGCPPCVSRSVVPQYITSIICGDDMVVRSTSESLKRCVKRVYKALKAGAGSSVPLGYMMGSGWVRDMAGSARQSLNRYTGNKHDISTLSVPGRVMFVKNRKMKSGATIQRVLRGNWQEDMLWQLHDILISPKMIEHHSLDNYIQSLNRC